MLDATCHRPEGAHIVVAVVELATPPPMTITPTGPEAEGLPNLGDAQASLDALVAELNAAAVPFLHDLHDLED